jgi:hypothetical protein
MHTFKSALEDFTRPLNASFEDSIHMPQNHTNKKRQKAAAARARKEQPQDTSVIQRAGIVPPEWRRVTPNLGPIPNWGAASGVEHDISEEKKGEELNASRGESGGHEVATGPSAPGTVAWSKIHEDQEAAARLEDTVQPAPLSTMKVFRRPGLGAASSSAALEQIRFLRLREQEQQNAVVPKSPTFMPNLHLSGSVCVQPLYEIAKAPACVLPDKIDSSSAHQAHDLQEMDNLTKAMEGLGVFQSIAALPPKDRSSKQEGAVLPPLSSGGKSASESFKEADGLQVRRGAQTVMARGSVQVEANKSTDSLASLSDEFEKIETPGQDESDHNGARKEWYKGFRR